MNQEQIMHVQELEAEAKQLQEHLRLIEQNISEMGELYDSITGLEENTDKETLMTIGKGIFVPVKRTDDTLLVDVGNKHFVKKSLKETKTIVKDQKEKLLAGKVEVLERLDELQKKMQSLLEMIEKEQSQAKK